MPLRSYYCCPAKDNKYDDFKSESAKHTHSSLYPASYYSHQEVSSPTPPSHVPSHPYAMERSQNMAITPEALTTTTTTTSRKHHNTVSPNQCHHFEYQARFQDYQRQRPIELSEGDAATCIQKPEHSEQSPLSFWSLVPSRDPLPSLQIRRMATEKQPESESGVSNELQDELDAIVLFLQKRKANLEQASTSDFNRVDSSLVFNPKQRPSPPTAGARMIPDMMTPPPPARPPTNQTSAIVDRDKPAAKAIDQTDSVPTQSTPQALTVVPSAPSSFQPVMITPRASSETSLPSTQPAYQMPSHYRSNNHRSPLDTAPIVKALSDIGSEVDSESRERYLLACRLLKAALIERETELLPSEQQFLQDILMQGGNNESEMEEALERKEHRLTITPEEHVLNSKALQSREYDFASPRAVTSMPNLIDEEATEVDTAVPSSVVHDEHNQAIVSVARFDGREFPFYILGITPQFKVGVLTPALMESLRSFFPYAIAEENFWLKYSIQRDGKSLPLMLSKMRTSKYTVLGIETRDGHVFGAFCSTPWKPQTSWFGSGENCFLWRLKRSRLEGSKKRIFDFDSEIEAYPYTGKDDQVQYCSNQSIAVGGGPFGAQGSPFVHEPTGIGFMVDGDLEGGESNSCATFCNPRLGSRDSTTNSEFDILNLEVWTTTSCVSIEEAEKLEMRKHFLQERKVR